MSTLYVYNTERVIHIQIDKIHVRYMGSKALNRFIKVNEYSDGCISVDVEFKINNQIEREEDYIDLRDVFADYNYDIEKIIASISEIKIGKPRMKKISKNDLIEKSLMVSDNMALLYKDNVTDRLDILVVNMKDTNARAVISVPNFTVISTNMSEMMLGRAQAAVKRNYEQLMDEIKERNLYA